MTQQLKLDDITNNDNDDDEPSSDDETTRIAVTYSRSNDNAEKNAQLQQGIEHAQNELEYDATISTDEPSGTAVRDDETGDTIAVFHDTNETHPREVEHLIDAVREHAVDDVIVDHVATLSDSIEDISEIVEIVNDEGATVYALDDNLVIPTGGEGEDVRATLRAAARTTRDALPRVTGQKHSGRPPAGFEVVEGKLRNADDYNELRNALINVIEHDMSHADAVRATNYSRATIINCKRQRDRYNLPNTDE